MRWRLAAIRAPAKGVSACRHPCRGVLERADRGLAVSRAASVACLGRARRAQAELAQLVGAGLARRLGGAAGGVADAVADRAEHLVLAARPGSRAAISAPAASPPASAISGASSSASPALRAGARNAVAGAVVGVERALPKVLRRGTGLPTCRVRSVGVAHFAVSVFALVLVLALARRLASSCALPTSLPARSISGSRARNKAIAATTPVGGQRPACGPHRPRLRQGRRPSTWRLPRRCGPACRARAAAAARARSPSSARCACSASTPGGERLAACRVTASP